MSERDWRDDASLARALLLRDLASQMLVKELVLPVPATGADARIAVPGGIIWEVLSFFVNFSTSAVVSNRTVRLQVEDASTNVVWRVDSNSLQAASLQVRYCFMAGKGDTYKNVDAVVSLGVPPPLALGGQVLRTNTSNLDAGDAYGLPAVMVRQWSPADVVWVSRYACQTAYEQRDV